MHGAPVTVTANAAVLVDGSTGTAERPVRVTLKAVTSTVYLGGADVASSGGTGYPLASTEAPIRVSLVAEKLWAVTASGSVVVDILASGL